jgi:hypothetical protein
MHGSMAARGVGGTTDRNNLSARQANGAEVDAAVQEEVQKMSERGVRLLKGIAEGTYNTKHAEAAKPTILDLVRVDRGSRRELEFLTYFFFDHPR